MSSKRESAIKWWKNLSLLEKKYHYKEYLEANTSQSSHFSTLSGREIELIYNQHNQEEVDTIQPHL